ncbi:hypothetical protein K435DRAFT_790905 [Dendrothele bispora CBS 962.96]|uniref:Uncharacterized protein n=1 Tax=Dendrothele bispora (strain CBS 962.96) TaxID=1314807 RepID=A0A4S8MNI2_DENBC|nr:hypothetical protein K435DRAFT_790905 [Dendrothele bispora CBS 962.96]
MQVKSNFEERPTLLVKPEGLKFLLPQKQNHSGAPKPTSTLTPPPSEPESDFNENTHWKYTQNTSVDFVLPVLWPQPDVVSHVRTRPDFAAAPIGWDVAVILAEIDSNAQQKDQCHMIMTGIVHAMVLRFIMGEPVVENGFESSQPPLPGGEGGSEEGSHGGGNGSGGGGGKGDGSSSSRRHGVIREGSALDRYRPSVEKLKFGVVLNHSHMLQVLSDKEEVIAYLKIVTTVESQNINSCFGHQVA